MVSNSSSCEHPQPQQLPPTLADFTSLAEKLLNTSQTLLDCCKRGQKFSGSGSVSDGKSSLASSKTPKEFRTYEIPGYSVDEEIRLLKEYKADCWQNVLNSVLDQFKALSLLLRNFDVGEEVNGFFLHSFAEDIMVHPLNMLNKLCSLVTEFTVCEAKPES